MSKAALTERERQYLECDIPLLTGSAAAMRITGAFFASLGQAFLPGLNKADSKLIRTVREIRYTKYKKAVLRKQEGTPEKGDEKILKKLNKTDFILSFETYDPDEFTGELYEDYMKKHDNEQQGLTASPTKGNDYDR